MIGGSLFPHPHGERLYLPEADRLELSWFLDGIDFLEKTRYRCIYGTRGFRNKKKRTKKKDIRKIKNKIKNKKCRMPGYSRRDKI
jgi:hypothetical protein